MNSDGFFFHIKQWLGDDAILLMDWDVRAMHLHLMCIAWQKTPPGTLPLDDAILKKWLSITNQNDWIDRIKPQLSLAWRTDADRWHQDGLIREWDRQDNNSQKRRAAANARWKKPADAPETKTDTISIPPEKKTEQTVLVSLEGEPHLLETQGFSLANLLKDSASFRQPATQDERTSIWTIGVKLLKHEGFSEDKVRSYLGKLIQEHGEKIVAEAVASLSLKPIHPADAKSYLIGILRTETSKRKGRGRVAL